MVQTDFRTALRGINEIEITVTGRKSGRSLSYPVWFVLEGEKLFLLPARGSDTVWYKNVLKTPTIRLTARGKTSTTSASPVIGEAKVGEVVQKFRDKDGARTVVIAGGVLVLALVAAWLFVRTRQVPLKCETACEALAPLGMTTINSGQKNCLSCRATAVLSMQVLRAGLEATSFEHRPGAVW